MPTRRLFAASFVAVLVVLAAVAPLATAATEASVKAELVSLELRPKKGVTVFAEIHPLLGVAVIETSMRTQEDGARGERYGAVDYAAHIPKGPLEGRLDVTVPGIVSIVGEVPADPETSTSASECSDGEEWSSEGEFRGSIKFRGNGGYLNFHARGAKAFVQQAASPECATGRPATRVRHPSLFAYLHSELHFSNSAAQILDSEVRLPGRHTSFLALRAWDRPVSAYAVETLEWLPGRVAARR